MQTRVSTGAPEPTRPNGRHLSLRARITCTVVCIERAFPLAFITCRRLCRDNQWRCSAHFASTPCKGRADSKNGAGRDNWPNVPKAPSFMGVTCDPECVEWAKAFDDCVCTNKDLVSFALGILSVVFFANCFLPQIILNFVSGSSEGLSVGMILVWSLGDLCNIIGVLLTGAMPTQFMMAILFGACDGILNFQNIYYSYWSVPRRVSALQRRAQQQQPHIGVAEANELEALLIPASLNAQAKSQMSTTPMEPSSSSSMSSSSTTTSSSRSETPPASPPSSTAAAPRLRSLLAGTGTPVGLMVLTCSMATIGVPLMWTAGVTGALRGGPTLNQGDNLAGFAHFASGHMLQFRSSTAPPSPGKAPIIFGSVLGWVMTCSYVGSRIPQLVKNYRRGMTTGLSLPMFVLLVLGSTTYVASIFVRSTARDFVVPKLPWLLEATGSAILDFSIVCQVLYFRRKNRDQPTAAALLPETITALL